LNTSNNYSLKDANSKIFLSRISNSKTDYKNLNMKRWKLITGAKLRCSNLYVNGKKEWNNEKI